MTTIPYPLVRVTYKDPTGPTEPWTEIEELKKGGPDLCVAVGYLIRDDETLIVLPHISETQGFGEISLPRGAVVSIEKLVPEVA